MHIFTSLTIDGTLSFHCVCIQHIMLPLIFPVTYNAEVKKTSRFMLCVCIYIYIYLAGAFSNTNAVYSVQRNLGAACTPFIPGSFVPL